MHTGLAIAGSLGWVLVVPYFFSLGFNELDILLYFISFFTVPLITLSITRNWRIKNYLTFGLGVRALCFIAAMWIVHPIQLMLIGAMFSFIISDYWTIYNTLVEDQTVKGNRAFINGIVMSIIPLVNIVTPVIAGAIADRYGFFWLLLIGFLLMLIPIYLARGMGEKRMLIDLFRAEHNNKHIREIMFLEGFADAAGWMIPAFVTLQFISNNFEYGSFFSYLALVGAVSGILLGRRSDRTGERGKYIVPVMLINGIGMIIAGFANSFLLWVVGLSIYKFFVQIEWPFTWAMITDSAKGIGDAMIAREFWLNSGRVSLVALTSIWVFYSGELQFGLVIGGLAFLVFPVFMKIKKLG